MSRWVVTNICELNWNVGEIGEEIVEKLPLRVETGDCDIWRLWNI